jgi:hypothetical protein
MSARNLMDGLTTYTNPEELAATSVAAQEQQSTATISISVVVSVSILYTETVITHD